MLTILQSRNSKDLMYNLIVLAIYIIIMTFVLRYLWNHALVKYISVLRPVDSLWHTFMLAFAIASFRC